MRFRLGGICVVFRIGCWGSVVGAWSTVGLGDRFGFGACECELFAARDKW